MRMKEAMGEVLEYHDKLLERLANVYLDKYELHGYEEARKWHERHTGNDKALKRLLRDKIREVAPKRGKVMKED